MRRHLPVFAALIVIGALWGLTQPLSKIAVSSGYRAPGLVFWQLLLGGVFLAGLCRVTGRRIPATRPAVRIYLFLALVGTILPNSASYEAVRQLPSGLVSILLSAVPMIAFPIAILLGQDRFSPARATGVAMGLLGVVLIAAPETSLPDRAMVAWLPLAVVAPLFYAIEGNVVDRWGLAGLDPIQALAGASLLGAVLVLPVTIATGTVPNPIRPWGAPEFAILGIAVIHALAYSGYVWLVGRAGAVFAAQVSYLVTGFGLFWAIVVLGERYSGWVWAAAAVILLGLSLVLPRPQRPVAKGAAPGE